MKRILILIICCISALCGCQCTNGTPSTNDAAGGDNYLKAVDRYIVEALGSHYDPAEHCIPVALVVATDESKEDEILVWGDFWVENYNQEGDTLKAVSGGSYPGLMHVSKTDDGYAVTKFEPVADGSGFIPSAKEIFGKYYDDFISSNSDDQARKLARGASIAGYVKANQLSATLYQDYGWDAEPIPLESQEAE